MAKPDYCKVFNELQPNLDVDLREGEWLAVTYMGHFRLGGVDGERLTLKSVELPMIVKSDSGNLVELILTHGRDTAEEEMEDFGYDREGPPITADFVVVKDTASGPEIHLHREAGVEVITLSGDLVMYEGKFYGDFSLDWKENTDGA